jgi:exopolysaccharide production protein ExoY
MFVETFPIDGTNADRGGAPSNNNSSANTPAPVDNWAMTFIDMSVAFVAILLLLPVLVLITAAIFVTDGRPIIFAHKRIGRYGRQFPCLKFRSMSRDADKRLAHLLATDPAAREEWDRDHKLRNDPRITKLGNFLRKTSLDELPQLFNVLRGEMSLVGPRPIVLGEVPRYGRYFNEYCSVKPGITGLWQVSGRNDVSYRRRVAMDVMYTRNRSTVTNVWILIATVPSVLASRGSY